MHERQIDGLAREVVPRIIERGGERHDATHSDPALGGGHRAVVVSSEDAVFGAGLDRAVALDAGGGEVAAARCLEHLEHGVAVVTHANRTAPALRAIDDGAEAAGQEIGFAGGPDAQTPEGDEEPATTLHEVPQRPASQAWRQGCVVDDHR